MVNDRPDLIVLGLDGASWTLLEKFMQQGHLPNLRELIAHSSRSRLDSIIPPVTGPAWPAIATGLNPGRLGTYDFYNRRSLDDYALYPVRSDQLRNRAFWDEVARQGFRVGVFGYPMLIPAYEINGWMVAGLGASKLQEWTFPRSLAEELEAVADPYEISVSYGLPKYRGNLDLLLTDLRRMLEGQIAALEHLMRTRPVELLVAVLGVTDMLSHTTWHLVDSDHPLYDAELSAQYIQLVHDLWNRVDAVIGLLHETVQPDGHLLIISDHGFGSSYGVFNTNTWLEQNGFLVRQNGSGSLSNSVRAFLVAHLAGVLAPLFKKLQGTSLHHAFRESILREIDLETSKAFALETTDVTGMIFVNRYVARARNIDESAFVENTKTELQNALTSYAERINLHIKISRPEEIYDGKLVPLAPDLLFSVDDGRVSASYQLASSVYEERLHLPMKTGNHRREGVFAGAGPALRVGAELPPSEILDVAPTVYHLLGLPVPADLDGHVILDALLEHHRDVRFIPRSDNIGADGAHAPEADLAEAEVMKRHLKELGYLE